MPSEHRLPIRFDETSDAAGPDNSVEILNHGRSACENRCRKNCSQQNRRSKIVLFQESHPLSYFKLEL